MDSSGVTLTRTSNEVTLDDSVEIELNHMLRLRAPVGSLEAVEVEYQSGSHRIEITGYGFLPIETLSSSTSAFVFRGRRGIVIPPVIGDFIMGSVNAHEVQVHTYHADDVPTGDLRVAWLGYENEGATLSFPLVASISLGCESVTPPYQQRRLGVPVAARAMRTLSIAETSGPITLSMWIYVDTDDVLDTWRDPYAGGLIIDCSALAVHLNGTTLTVDSGLDGAGEVQFTISRGGWIFICVRSMSVVVAQQGLAFRESALNVPLAGLREVTTNVLAGVHVRSLSAYSEHLDDGVVRTLADARLGPRMRYDRAHLQLPWPAREVIGIGRLAQLVLAGPPSRSARGSTCAVNHQR
mmetsp:Transcript_34805/g.86737  ORF Transcript_34805/g.86737 Transcript_34805/m.86737 type:complete len:353 (+) Transcript_34805:195-1253(+)